jgi:hypothetical protein
MAAGLRGKSFILSSWLSFLGAKIFGVAFLPNLSL